MRSEILGKTVGAVLGAALLIAGLAAFSPAIAGMQSASAPHPVQFVLHASEEINVRGN